MTIACKRFLRRAHALACVVLLFLTFALPVHAQPNDLPDQVRPDNPAAEPDRWLTDERWGELRYGLTIRQPKQAELIEQTREGALARWRMPNGSNVSLTIYRGVHYKRDARGNVTQERVHLNTVVVDMIATLEAGGAGVSPMAQLKPGSAGRVHNTKSDQWLKVGELLGYTNYFVMVPSGSDEGWLYGIALLQLDDTSVMVLRLECTQETILESICMFESMLNSVEVQAPGQATQRIRGWIDNGVEFIDAIDTEQYQAALKADRLYRIVESGRDIGYQRVWQRYQDRAYYQSLLERLQRENPDAQLDGIDAFRVTGNAMVVRTHYDVNGIRINNMQEFIDDASGENEYWQIKSSLDAPGNSRSDMAGAWVETGLRGKANFQNRQVDQIQVVREGTPPRQMTEFVLAREQDPNRRLRFPSARPDMVPSGDKDSNAWPTPPKAYISAIDAVVIPALLPADQPRTYAFFAYHAESTAVALRIMRVEPLGNGGKRVHIRPTIDLAEQTLEYDANNELVRWTFHDGREILPTTRQELNQIWRARESSR